MQRGRDSGADSLAQALKHNRTLAKLSLGGNSFHSRGAWALEDALRTNRTLTHLDLEGLEGADVAWRAILKLLDANREHCAALFLAVTMGGCAQVRNLLQQGACPLSGRDTILHVAVARGDPRVIEEVIVGSAPVLPYIESVTSGKSGRDALISFEAENTALHFGPASRVCMTLHCTVHAVREAIAAARPPPEYKSRIGRAKGERLAVPVIIARLDLPMRLRDHCDEVAKVCEKHRVLGQRLSPPEWKEAFKDASNCVKHLPRPIVDKTIEGLSAAEQAVVMAEPPTEFMLKTRHDARLGLQTLFAEELRSLLTAIAAMDREARCLKSMGFDAEDVGETSEWKMSDVTLPDLSELLEEEGNLAAASNKLRDAVLSAWSSGGFDPRVDAVRFASVQTDVLAMLQKSRLDMVKQQLRRAKEHLKDFFCRRSAAVASTRHQMMQHAGELKEHIVRLDRAVEANDRIPALMEGVDKAGKELNRAKIQARRAREDVELGDGSEENVVMAQAKMAAARVSHELAVAAVLAVRQTGYPELRCAAAAPRDQFSLVPRISFSEIEIGAHEHVKLGGGMFADVLLVELPVSGQCAFKRFRKASGERELMREAAAMWDVRRDDHVVRLLKVCSDKGHQGLLLELMEGGSLRDRLLRGKLSEPEALQVFSDVAAGLVAVHGHKHVHLDVKADNVFLTKEGRAKLGDFGSSKEVRETLHDTKFALTFQWTAPELLCDMPRASPAADVWSFGMLMFETLTGEVPFAEIDSFNIVRSIHDGKLPNVNRVDGKFSALVPIMQSCWNRDAAQRPTAAQLVQLIQAHMLRQCLYCSEQTNLTRGLLCSKEKAFLCHLCVPEMIQSVARSGEVPSDGSLLPEGSGGCVFELHRLRLLVSPAVFEKWEEGRMRTRQIELERGFARDLEEARIRWERLSEVERLAVAIETDILGPGADTYPCPGCKTSCEFVSGCMVLTHRGGCGRSFCGFCFGLFDAGPAHDHARVCAFNTANRGNYDLPANGNTLAVSRGAARAPSQRTGSAISVRRRASAWRTICAACRPVGCAEN